MAARKHKGTKTDPWPQKTRDRIQTSMLINRLVDHALGNNDPQTGKPVQLSPTQVTAANILLKKVMPDLAATELSGEVARPTVIRAPDTVADSKAWLDKHGPKRVHSDVHVPDGKLKH